MSDKSGNGLLDNANDLLASFTNAGEKVAGIYSTFLGAQANLKIAEAQKVNAQHASDTSQEVSDKFSGENINKIATGALVLAALIGTGWLIWRAVK